MWKKTHSRISSPASSAINMPVIVTRIYEPKEAISNSLFLTTMRKNVELPDMQ
jgi:hypothetical protein